LCHEYQQEICPRLSKPPYVCNGYEDRFSIREEGLVDKGIFTAGNIDMSRIVRMDRRKKIKIGVLSQKGPPSMSSPGRT